MVLENAPALTNFTRITITKPTTPLIKLTSRIERSYNNAL